MSRTLPATTAIGIADGTNRRDLKRPGRSYMPDMNAAGGVVYHDGSFTLEKRLADGTIVSLGSDAAASWDT